MFFMMGITDGRKEIAYNGDMFICSQCGAYGRFTVFMTYTVLSLFFIPVFKWNKHFYVTSSCCGTVYELSFDIGQRLLRGENVTILPEYLQLVSPGRKPEKRCACCGYHTTEDFEFCPKCGNRFTT